MELTYVMLGDNSYEVLKAGNQEEEILSQLKPQALYETCPEEGISL